MTRHERRGELIFIAIVVAGLLGAMGATLVAF